MNRLDLYAADRLLYTDYAKISAAIVPSRSIHFGFVFTALHALWYMRQNPRTTLEVTATDNAYDPQMGNNFIPYNKRACGCPQHVRLQDHVAHELVYMLGESAQFFQINPKRINVDFFTDRLKRDRESSAVITDILSAPEKARRLKRALFDDGSRPYFVPATANCSECGHTNSHLGRVDREKKILTSICHNESCIKYKKESHIGLESPWKFNLHYMIDPIRDLFWNDYRTATSASKGADLHIFGGDYAMPHGESQVPRVERVRNVMRIVKEDIPDVFIAPLVTWSGEKVGKSTSRFFPYFGWSIEQRRQFMLHAYQMLEKHMGQPVVDFN